MNDLGYIIAGWAIGLGVPALYTIWVLVRGRALTQQVPPERRRWMTSDG